MTSPFKSFSFSALSLPVITVDKGFLTLSISFFSIYFFISIYSDASLHHYIETAFTTSDNAIDVTIKFCSFVKINIRKQIQKLC